MSLGKSIQKAVSPVALAALLGTWRRGQPVPAPLKEHAVHLRASGIGSKAIARLIGVTPEAVRLWVRAASGNGQQAPVPTMGAPSPATTSVSDARGAAGPVEASPTTSPRDNAYGLSDHEIAAILTLKKQHPSMGPGQIRAQLKRFKGWRLSVRAIARVLAGPRAPPSGSH